MNIVTGSSFSDNPELAGYEAANAALSKIKSIPRFGIVFCSNKRFQDEESLNILVKTLHKTFKKANPNFEWVGCTTDDISGCTVLVTSSKNIHQSIGISKHSNKFPKIAGQKAANEALSKIDLDNHIMSYISSLAEKDHSKTLDEIHPFLITALIPHNVNSDDILHGVNKSIGTRAQVSAHKGHTFSNGVLFKDATILLLKAFDHVDEFDSFKNKWTSSMFKE